MFFSCPVLGRMTQWFWKYTEDIVAMMMRVIMTRGSCYGWRRRSMSMTILCRGEENITYDNALPRRRKHIYITGRISKEGTLTPSQPWRLSGRRPVTSRGRPGRRRRIAVTKSNASFRSTMARATVLTVEKAQLKEWMRITCPHPEGGRGDVDARSSPAKTVYGWSGIKQLQWPLGFNSVDTARV